MPHDCHVCMQIHIESQRQPPANRRTMLGLNMPHEYDCHVFKSTYRRPTNVPHFPTCPHDCCVHTPVHINSQCQLPVSHPRKVEALKGLSSCGIHAHIIKCDLPISAHVTCHLIRLNYNKISNLILSTYTWKTGCNQLVTGYNRNRF